MEGLEKVGSMGKVRLSASGVAWPTVSTRIPSEHSIKGPLARRQLSEV